MSSQHTEGPLPCAKSDLPGVIELVDTVMRRGTGQSFLTDYPLVYSDENLRNISIIKVSGKVISVVPFIPHDVAVAGCRFRIGIISPTATAPDHRRKGYALRCLRHCAKGMSQAGCDVAILWTGPNNFPFYARDDYQVLASQGWTYRCDSRDARRFADHGETIAEYDRVGQEHLERIRLMHEREVCGIRRPPKAYPYLFSLSKLKTSLAFRGDELVGYLVVGSGVNKPGLVEGGGDSKAVETLVHHALSQLPEGAYLDGYRRRTPDTLGDLLEKRLPAKRRPIEECPAIGWTLIRLNKPGAFLRKIAPWLQQRNTQPQRTFSIGMRETGEVISLRFAQGTVHVGAEKLDPHMQLSRMELTSLIFGAHPGREIETSEATRGLFPFYFPVPVLDHS